MQGPDPACSQGQSNLYFFHKIKLESSEIVGTLPHPGYCDLVFISILKCTAVVYKKISTPSLHDLRFWASFEHKRAVENFFSKFVVKHCSKLGVAGN